MLRTRLLLPLTLVTLAATLGACNNNEQAPEATKTYSDAFATETVLLNLVDFNEGSIGNLTISPSNLGLSYKSLGAGERSAVLELSSEHRESALTITPEQSWQVGNLAPFNLAFDLVNHNEHSTHIYLDVFYENDKYQQRSIAVPGKFRGTVYFPLSGKEVETDSGLWGDEPPWQTEDAFMIWRSWRPIGTNLEAIHKLRFFGLGLIEDRKVEIDNIRLRANPESDPGWMKNVIDQFGQNAKVDSVLKISSEEELRKKADEELAVLAASTGAPDRSQYGGYSKGPKLEATGYFRTTKHNGKWWMVDPEGYLFLSHGPANVRMANMTTYTGMDYKDESIRHRSADETTPEDSMGIIRVSDEIRQSAFVTNELRRGMFEWLPGYDSELAEHYSYRRSSHKGPIEHGETFSFYRANLERRYGQTEPESYIKKWNQVTIDRMKDWGFTSFGNWVDPAFYELNQVPYFANGWIIGDFKTLSGYENHWGLMPDPFDPFFAERAEVTISGVAKEVNASPWCVGIFIDNEKSWGEREGTVPQRYGVILDAISKDAAESPAKHAFADRLKAKYISINALNEAWDTQVASWEAFDKGVVLESYNDAMVADLSALLEALGEQYFEVVHGTLEKYLPNHLYMGARMANWGMPDEVIKASLKYSDVLSFNIYEEGVQAKQWDFLEEVDLPVAIGEFHIGFAGESGMFNPGIVHASDQKDRARKYSEYMASVIDKPYLVAAHWFQYIDEPISGRAHDGENANIGFVDVTDQPYPELIKAVKEVTYSMYERRLEN